MTDSATWRAFENAVDAIPGVSDAYPLAPPAPQVKPFRFTASTNYSGLAVSVVLTLALVAQPLLCVAVLWCVGWQYGADVGVSLALVVLISRAVLVRVWGPARGDGVHRVAGFGPGTYYHGMGAAEGAPAAGGAAFADRVAAWTKTRPHYERDYEAWWVGLYRLFDFGCLLTGYEATGDGMTLLEFIFYQRLRTADPYQRRTWVEVPRYTDGEDALGGDAAGTEALACDWAFPTQDGAVAWSGATPLLIVLHGLNGGSRAMYVLDTVEKGVLDQKYVVCSLNARGFGGTPVASDGLWHGARCADLRVAIGKVLEVWDACCEAETAARGSTRRANPCYAAGFSMGALGLMQVIDRFGRPDAAWGSDFGVSADGARRLKLHGVVAISGLFNRAHETGPADAAALPALQAGRTWHPLLGASCVDSFSVHKDCILTRAAAAAKAKAAEAPQLSANGYPARQAYAPVCYATLCRAPSVRDVDVALTAPYHGFGSGVQGFRNYCESQTVAPEHMQMCPVLHLAALDDPVIPPAGHTPGVRRVVPGKHRPHKCVTYLTRSGGHLGWMQGNFFTRRNWAFMTDTLFSFLAVCGEEPCGVPSACQPSRA
eukprot:TRINITY_DN13973_c0_g1_i1.p1 TRINITY_DN13973_c0_g1~~TRINITY_DN13973_c0_g1_i1.p1  ORF type:complete len:600 (+),score=175.41 TRINITY_DN13973_c0_g1_i1:457-2256(+)